jgi:hypothetical protein
MVATDGLEPGDTTVSVEGTMEVESQTGFPSLISNAAAIKIVVYLMKKKFFDKGRFANLSFFFMEPT